MLRKSLIILSALVSLSAQAESGDVLNAQIKDGSLVVTVEADCNSYGASLRYVFSNKASFGPHHYELSLLSTMMGCPNGDKRELQLVVALPERRDGDRITIRTLTQGMSYTVKNPQADQELAIATKVID